MITRFHEGGERIENIVTLENKSISTLEGKTKKMDASVLDSLENQNPKMGQSMCKSLEGQLKQEDVSEKHEGLSDAEKEKIERETGWSDEIIDAIDSMEEYEIYKKLDYKKLKSMVVNVLFAVISIGSRKMKWGVPTENVCSRDSLLTIKTEK